jgi:putative hydrolase
MFDLVADLHTHTIASGHGADTIRTMGEFAVKRGLKGIAVTDHGPALPGGASVVYFMSIRRVAGGIRLPIRIITGVEDDIKNKKGELTLPPEVLEGLEIVMTGCHPETWIARQNQRVRTDAVVNAMGRGFVKVLTHPIGTYYPIDVGEVLAAAKVGGTALELNASKLGQRSLAAGFLERCASEHVRVVVNTDAHMVEEVGEFSFAKDLLAEVGFPAALVVNRSIESIEAFFGFRW